MGRTQVWQKKVVGQSIHAAKSGKKGSLRIGKGVVFKTGGREKKGNLDRR